MTCSVGREAGQASVRHQALQALGTCAGLRQKDNDWDALQPLWQLGIRCWQGGRTGERDRWHSERWHRCWAEHGGVDLRGADPNGERF